MKRIDSVLAALVVAVVVLGQSSEVQADHSPTNDPQLQSAHLCLKLVADFAQRPVLKNECKHKVIIYGLRGGFTNIGKGTINKGVTTGPGILDIEYTSGRVCVEYADGRTDNGGEAEQRDAGQKRCPSNRPLDDKDYDPFTMYPPEKLDAGLRGFPKTVEVPEGGSGTFKVRLTTSPRENLDDPDDDPAVTVTFASPGNDLTIDTDSVQSGAQNTVTFTGANWGMPRTVTVTSSASDDDVAVPAPVEVTVTATGGGSGDYSYAGVSGTLTIQVTETDEANLVLEDPTGTLSVNEGGTGTFKVKLSAQPGAAVTVNIASSNTDVTFSPPSLSFSASTWDAYQTVTVTAAQDDGAQDDEATLTLTASGGGFDDVNAAKEVKVVDDDLVKFDIDIAADGSGVRNLAIDEGGDATFKVRLNNKPAKNTVADLSQVVTAARPKNPDVSFTPIRLTFTTSDWNVYQTVRVSAAADADTANETVIIALAGSEDGGYKGLPPPDGIPVTPGPLTPITPGTLPTGPGTTPDPPCVGEDCVGAPLPTNPVATTFLDSVKVTVTDSGTAAQPVLSTTALEVDEGSSATFTVAMNKAPGSATTVNLSVPSGSAVSTSPTSLNFTANDWSAKTVTVSAAEDANRIGETVNITLSPRAQGVDGGAVVVSVKDNDALNLVLSPTSISINEGETAEFTVKLGADPGTETEIAVRSDHIYVKVDTDLRLGGYQNTLTFTAGSNGNWNTPQRVRLTADDEIDLRDRDTEPPTEEEDTFTVDPDDEDVTISLTAATVATASLGVRVLDDEVLRPQVSVSSALIVDEGSSATFDVKLSKDPGTGITVNVVSTDTTAVTVDKSTLNFSAATGGANNWNTPQTVRVTAQQDADGTDDRATINLTAAALDQPAAVEVRVKDDESGPELIVSPDTLSVAEGGSAPFTVRLNSRPSASVTVTLAQSGADNDDVSFDTDPDTNGDQSTLTFTADDWDMNQTVTVSAAHDSDTADDSATIGLTAAGGGFDNITESVAVSVPDKGAPDLTLAGLNPSDSSLTVDEDDSAEFTVRLSVRPSADVRVSLARSGSTDVTLDTDPDTNGDQDTLDFTTDDWQTPQTVTVSAADDGDSAADTATISLTASGGDYASVTKNVSVNVTDDDSPGLTLAVQNRSVTTLTVAEDDSEDFTVRLNTQPSAEVTVTLARSGSTDVTLDTDPDTNGDQDTLTFSTSNWDSPQTVTVSAADDGDITDDTATITLTPSGGDYADVTAVSLSVTVTDDDSPGFAFTRTPLTVAEGETGTFMVALKTLPSANVTVTLEQPSNTDVTLDTDTGQSGNQNTLTFETGNWDSPQTVTVAAAEDSDGDNDTATITLTASGGGYDGVNTDNTVAVTVSDDDSIGFTLLPASELTLNEGASGNFTVRLKTLPSADVTVTLAQSGSTDVTFDTDTGTAGDQATLTFTSATDATGGWNMDQTVTVAAAEDDDGAEDTATLSLTATGGGYDSATASLGIEVTDDDPAGLTIVPSNKTLAVNEGGSADFTVRLKTKPSQNVTVALAQSGTSNDDISLDDDELIFTPQNWDRVQTVRVSAEQDDDAVADTATISLTASGGGSGGDSYANITENVRVNVSDDDAAGLTLSLQRVDIVEGATATFTVRLKTRPAADVRVTLEQSGTVNQDVSIDTDADTSGTQKTLTFTPANWNVPQTVTLAAAEDDDGNEDSATISFTAAGGGSGGNSYDNVTDSLSVKVTDTDAPGLILSSRLIEVDEGDDGTFDMRLAILPDVPVTVTLTQPANGDVKVDTDPDTPGNQTTLTFAIADWNKVQTVTVAAADDNDASDERATIALTATGGSYAGLSAEVEVKVIDDDSPGFTLSTPELTVSEGRSGDFTVRLNTRPSATVTVRARVTQSSHDGITLSPQSLTFTSANWRTPKTVTVNTAEDDDAGEDGAKISLTASGGDYGDVTAGLSLKVSDDDRPGLEISKASLTVVEGEPGGEFTVNLATRPSQSVTVRLGQSGTANSDVIVDTESATPGDQDTLIFTSENWNSPRRVVVRAVDDDDGEMDSATISLTASGGGSGGNDHSGVSGEVRISVTDDESPGLVISSRSLNLIENGSATFTLRLVTKPNADVTVRFAVSPPNSDLSVDTDPDTTGNQDTLTFTAGDDDNEGNWQTPQTVSVFAAEDDDAFANVAAISISSSGGGYDGVGDRIGVTVSDGDTPGITLSKTLLKIEEEGKRGQFEVKLDTRPSQEVTITVALARTNESIGFTATGLTFGTDNWNNPQTVTVTTEKDSDAQDESETIILTASNGDYEGIVRRVSLMVMDIDRPGELVSNFETLTSDDSDTLTIEEGESRSFGLNLERKPTVVEISVALSSKNDDIEFEPNTLKFTNWNWDEPQPVVFTVREDDDAAWETADITMTASGGNYEGVIIRHHLNIMDDEESEREQGITEPGEHPSTWPLRSHGFAIPPVAAQGDEALVRLYCKEESVSCVIFFDCSAQNDTGTYRGRWLRAIPPRGADTVALDAIAEIVGDSLEGKGRLSCGFRSQQMIVSQVWTRSGDGVLANNSHAIHSHENQADIGSIPSPNGRDVSNIRIRCNKGGAHDCTDTRLECAEDDGTVHTARVGAILRGIVRHIQTRELADLLDHEWEGMNLSCTVFSDRPFTVQILTRTGGGRALVNNTAVSAYREDANAE